MTQAFVQMPEGRRGRPFREEQDLPPQIQQGLFCVLLERLGLIALLERVSMSATFVSGESIHRQSHF